MRPEVGRDRLTAIRWTITLAWIRHCENGSSWDEYLLMSLVCESAAEVVSKVGLKQATSKKDECCKMKDQQMCVTRFTYKCKWSRRLLLVAQPPRLSASL